MRHGQILPGPEVLLQVLPGPEVLLQVLPGPEVLVWVGKTRKVSRTLPLLR